MVIKCQTAEQPGDENLLGDSTLKAAATLDIRSAPRVLQGVDHLVNCASLTPGLPKSDRLPSCFDRADCGPSALARKAREIRVPVLPLLSLTLISPLPFV